MLKTLAKLMGLAALGWAGSAYALGLGEIEIKTRLNQPLSAVIPISSATPRELESLSIELASNEDFERAGMERAEFLSSLKFEIKDKLIRVTSKDLAREPFVSFLLDVRWSGGRLLREYTVLLDPPTLAQPEKPAAKPVVSQANEQVIRPVQEPVRLAEPVAKQPAVPTSAPPASVLFAEQALDAYAGEMYGPIQPKETLWSVAYKLRPDPALTMDQMQVAIFNANPKAFEDRRLTGLMKGSMIRIPSLDEIRAVDPIAAKAQVAQANRADRAAPAVPPAQTLPAPAVQPAPVTVEPAASAAAAPADVEPAAAPADQAVVEPAPAQTDDASTVVTPAPADPSPMVDEPAPAQAGPAGTVQTEALPPPTVAPVAASDDAGVLEQALALVDHPLFLPVVAGLAAVLILFVLIRQLRDKYAQWSYERASRKKIVPTAEQISAPPAAAAQYGSEPYDEDAATLVREQPAAVEPAETMGATQGMAERTQQQAMQQTLQQTQALTQTQAHDATAAQTGAPKVDFDVSGTYATETVQINLDAGDPVSEAEFHRAYGLYDEAALLLKQALQKDPKRKDARVKLAEIYFEANKADEFVQTAKELKNQLPDDEWQKIALLGSQIAAGNDLFQGATAGGAVDLSFDEPAPPATAAAAPAAADSGLLDFSLDDVKMPDKAAPAAKPASPASPVSDALEFDLGSLSLDEPAPAAAPAPAPAAAGATGGADDFKMADLGLGDFDLKLDEAATPGAAPADAGGELSLEEAPASGDESSTKLDLARAYMDMGDNDMAKSLLNEVHKQGSEQQKKEAQELLSRVSG